ncbi:MAG: alpha/beta hydrolase [Coprobacillus sp.]
MNQKSEVIHEQTTIQDILELPSFYHCGRLLFPIDRAITTSMTLKDLSTSRIYIWYHYIQVSKTVEIIQTLNHNAKKYPIFYSFYSKEEILEDSSRRDTGLFFFKGNDDAPYAVCNAGGGFAYVGALHDSFPHALEISRKGYNAFVLIYRVESPYEDLGRALMFIHDNAESLKVDKNHYSLWGGSAGARMAAILGNKKRLSYYVGTSIPQADAVIMQYTGYSQVSQDDAPTYACVGTHDGIADYKWVEARLNCLSQYNIPTEFHSYQGLPHGFGLGTGTVAEGWIHDAIRFWEKQM